MSSRQIAHAATGGRRVTFLWLTAKHTIEGYIVGMDDFHWLVIPTDAFSDWQPVMIHKASPDITVISTESSLDSEPDHVKVAVEEIGRGFFTYCDKIFLGRN
jgi:hypothetical protein